MFTKTKEKETQKATENKDIQDTKKNQISELTMAEEMDRMFDRFLENRWPKPFFSSFPELNNLRLHSDVRLPSVDIVEKDDNIIVRAEIPGIDKKDIDITLTANSLTLQGKSRNESKEDTGEYHRSEISTASFSRTLTLPTDVNSDNVKATFNNGLLEITLPKVENGNNNKIEIE